MDFPRDISEDLTASLPPQRDDEPSSLRQDILDELNDHLQCAVRREQCRLPTDDRSVWQRVVARFGDPRAVAVKLYWQALWSRVMQQRMILAGGAGGLILGVVMVAMMWMMLQGQQDLVKQQLLASERHQATMEALVARLSNPPSTLATLKVRTDRPASFLLMGGNLTKPIPLSAVADQKEYDFGELDPGVYMIHMDTYESAEVWGHDRQVVLKTGESHIEEVVVPPAVETAKFTITTNLPNTSFHTLDLHVLPRGRTTFHGKVWTRSPSVAAYRFCQKASFSADLVGRAQLTLTYSDNQIRGSLTSWEDRTDPNSLQDDDIHVIEVELQPGQNSVQVDVPDKWIDKLNRQRELALSKITEGEIQKVVQQMLEGESQKEKFKDATTKYVAIIPITDSSSLPDHRTDHAVLEAVYSAVDKSKNYQLIDPDRVNRSPDQNRVGSPAGRS